MNENNIAEELIKQVSNFPNYPIKAAKGELSKLEFKWIAKEFTEEEYRDRIIDVITRYKWEELMEKVNVPEYNRVECGKNLEETNVFLRRNRIENSAANSMLKNVLVIFKNLPEGEDVEKFVEGNIRDE